MYIKFRTITFTIKTKVSDDIIFHYNEFAMCPFCFEETKW